MSGTYLKTARDVNKENNNQNEQVYIKLVSKDFKTAITDTFNILQNRESIGIKEKARKNIKCLGIKSIYVV